MEHKCCRKSDLLPPLLCDLFPHCIHFARLVFQNFPTEKQSFCISLIWPLCYQTDSTHLWESSQSQLVMQWHLHQIPLALSGHIELNWVSINCFLPCFLLHFSKRPQSCIKCSSPRWKYKGKNLSFTSQVESATKISTAQTESVSCTCLDIRSYQSLSWFWP